MWQNKASSKKQTKKLVQLAGKPRSKDREKQGDWCIKSFKSKALSLYENGKETEKDNFENGFEREYQEQEQEINLTPHELETTLNRAYGSFRLPELPKTDGNTYTDQIIP